MNFSGRFYTDRDPLYAEALHVNSSYMTAVANDYSFDVVYSRMIKKAVGERAMSLWAFTVIQKMSFSLWKKHANWACIPSA